MGCHALTWSLDIAGCAATRHTGYIGWFRKLSIFNSSILLAMLGHSQLSFLVIFQMTC